jgi:UDP-3-O-[3-hydroxymyristoyl] glucosamine N-acyltransferase
VLGGDGFGYRLIDGRHVKIPQTGRVEIGDDVEIGANCTVDRATFEATRIGDGSKIDNLVMIGHNNQIGRHNLLCGQVGIAGSCKTGDYVVMAGQAGIKDKTEIGDRVMIGAQAGVHRNIAEGQQVLGSPAIPVREQRRIFQMIARLPEMHKQLRELSAQVTLLMAALPPGSDELEDDPTGF